MGLGIGALPATLTLVMRVLVMLCVVGGCTKAQPDEPPRDPPRPVPTPVVIDAGPPGPQPIVVDKPAPVDAPASAIIDVPTLAMAGPYPTLAASCATAKPCGALTEDSQGNPLLLPAKPDCSAVLDQTQDPINMKPHSMGGGPVELAHAVPGGELRIGGVQCAIPKGARGSRSDHYMFVKRADGWWRTDAPVFEHSYNEKYCSGSMYVLWNIKAARTIIGLAGSRDCLACSKQLFDESIREVMLRVALGGPKPRVFAPLPVGVRYTVRDGLGTPDPSTTSDPDCKLGTRMASLKEKWPADDEVILDMPSITNAPPNTTFTGGPLTAKFTMGYLDLARPGHYRFPR